MRRDNHSHITRTKPECYGFSSQSIVTGVRAREGHCEGAAGETETNEGAGHRGKGTEDVQQSDDGVDLKTEARSREHEERASAEKKQTNEGQHVHV